MLRVITHDQDDRVTPPALHASSPEAQSLRNIWARGAFVEGMALLVSGGGASGLGDADAGADSILAALDGGYAPVEFKEHVKALDALKRRSPRTRAEIDAHEATGGQAEPRGDLPIVTPRERLRQALVLTEAVLAMPSSHHGANIYTRASLHMNAAGLLLKLNDTTGAVGKAAASLQANPIDPSPYVFVSRIQKALGDTAKSMQGLGRLRQVFQEPCTRCAAADTWAGKAGECTIKACVEVPRVPSGMHVALLVMFMHTLVLRGGKLPMSVSCAVHRTTVGLQERCKDMHG